MAGVALAMAAGMLLPGTAAGQNTGVLEGQVAQGTPDGAAPGVTLLRVRKFRGMTEVGAVDSATDAQGRFRIEGLEVNKDLRYYVEAGHQNVAYRTDPLDLTALSGPITLTVYDTTASDEAIRIDTVLVEFSRADARTGFIGVSERVTVLNTGPRTFVGDLFTNPATGRSLRLPLPLAALDIRLGHGFGPDGVLPTDEGMASRTPVTPGETVLLFGYDLPYEGTAVSMEHAWAYPVTDLFVLVPEGSGTPASPTLTQAGRVTFEGNTFLVLQGAGLVPDVAATIGVEGLPPIAVAKVYADTAMRVAAVAMLGAIAVAVTAYAATARRRGGAMADATASPLEEERRRLVGALAEMDDARDGGRLPQAEHEQARALEKRRLVEVMLLLEDSNDSARKDSAREAPRLEVSGG
ncbi:MAG: hypothetical protein EXR49_08330 [Dehalococcoidia bacterium]|nr:hypothetical protein [Dehalococcoidia bacterium]